MNVWVTCKTSHKNIVTQGDYVERSQRERLVYTENCGEGELRQLMCRLLTDCNDESDYGKNDHIYIAIPYNKAAVYLASSHQHSSLKNLFPRLTNKVSATALFET
jgi:hypothetical protein